MQQLIVKLNFAGNWWHKSVSSRNGWHLRRCLSEDCFRRSTVLAPAVKLRVTFTSANAKKVPSIYNAPRPSSRKCYRKVLNLRIVLTRKMPPNRQLTVILKSKCSIVPTNLLVWADAFVHTTTAINGWRRLPRGRIARLKVWGEHTKRSRFAVLSVN